MCRTYHRPYTYPNRFGNVHILCWTSHRTASPVPARSWGRRAATREKGEGMSEKASKGRKPVRPNMPTTIEATTYFQENGVAFMPGKAANAGGVLVSGLEMSQNAEHLSWTFEEVDGKLEQLMRGMFHNVDDTAKEYGEEGNFVMGANIAGFLKVADAMLAQGIV